MPPPLALVVDDEPSIRELLKMSLEDMGLCVIAVGSCQEAFDTLRQQTFDLCLTDWRLPDGLGLSIVKTIQAEYNSTPVAVITAYSSAETAVEAMKAGAFDYVAKPIQIKRLRELVRDAVAIEGNSEPTHPDPSQKIIGRSPAIVQLREQIKRLGRSQAPVHISGESGTGKELVAMAIHEAGTRATGPFIPVNCGAIPENLVESEFFGHVKGAFTGAIANKAGFFEAAKQGTLFLDEIGDLPLAMQVKLLRALQERSVRPIGANKEVSVDVRIVSATHHDLNQLVADKKFREDLFYRINVIPLRIPALRERLEDIPLLVPFLLERIAKRTGEGLITISNQALSALGQRNYPGNVRELENLLERAAALRTGADIDIDDLDLSEPSCENHKAVSIDEKIDQTERQLLLDALKQANGVKTEAARILGISFRSFRYRLKKLGID